MSGALLMGGCVLPSTNIGLPVAPSSFGASFSGSAEQSDMTYYSRNYVIPGEEGDHGGQVSSHLGSGVPMPTQFSGGLRYGIVAGIDAGVEASLAHVGVNTRIDLLHLLHGFSEFHLVLTGDYRLTASHNWNVTSRLLLYVPLLNLNSDGRLSVSVVLGPDASTGRFRYNTLHEHEIWPLDVEPVERRELRTGGVLGLSLLDTVGYETVFFASLYTTPEYENIGTAAEYNQFDRHTGLLFAVTTTLGARK